MSIQKFIKEELPKLNLDLNNVVAVCNAVPDEEARNMVLETFPRHFVAYPGLGVKTTIGDGIVKRQNYKNLQEDCEYGEDSFDL